VTTEHGASWMATMDVINSVRRPSERLQISGDVTARHCSLHRSVGQTDYDLLTSTLFTLRVRTANVPNLRHCLSSGKVWRQVQKWILKLCYYIPI